MIHPTLSAAVRDFYKRPAYSRPDLTIARLLVTDEDGGSETRGFVVVDADMSDDELDDISQRHGSPLEWIEVDVSDIEATRTDQLAGVADDARDRKKDRRHE